MPELLYNRKANATLANLAAGGRFPHTLLIEGPEGSGKKTAAWQAAKTLLCEGEPKPCGRCAHCVKADKRVHPDVRYYTCRRGRRNSPSRRCGRSGRTRISRPTRARAKFT